MKSTRRAFTLIELLVVIAIIAIVAAILFPVLARAKAAGRRATCTSNMRQIYEAMRMFAADHDDIYPSVHCGALLFQLEPYLRNMKSRENTHGEFELDKGAKFALTAWVCPAANANMVWMVKDTHWTVCGQTPPWYKYDPAAKTWPVFCSYGFNFDVIYSEGPLARPSQIVLMAESRYEPNPNTMEYLPDYVKGATVYLILQPDYGRCDGWYSPHNSTYFIYPWHDGRGNFLYADGHVRTLSEVPPRGNWQVPIHDYEPPR